MIEAGVARGACCPESAASRHAQSMDIAIDAAGRRLSVREMQICVRSLEALPSFAQELVQMLVDDAQGGWRWADSGLMGGAIRGASRIHDHAHQVRHALAPGCRGRGPGRCNAPAAAQLTRSG